MTCWQKRRKFKDCHWGKRMPLISFPCDRNNRCSEALTWKQARYGGNAELSISQELRSRACISWLKFFPIQESDLKFLLNLAWRIWPAESCHQSKKKGPETNALRQRAPSRKQGDEGPIFSSATAMWFNSGVSLKWRLTYSKVTWAEAVLVM